MSVFRPVVLGMFCALLAACPPKPPPPPADGGSDDCFEDKDCPDPSLFSCNTSTSKCEPACTVKADCTAAVRGQYALDFCASGLGCQCDEGKCVGSKCSADADCGAQVCRDGACVDPPAASAVAGCELVPDMVVVRGNGSNKVKFSVLAWDASKKPIVPKGGVTWAAVGSALTVSGAASGLSQEFTVNTAGAATGPADAAKATVGSVSCTARAVVLPGSVAAQRVAVAVWDELSGRPIEGAQVLLSNSTGGAIGNAQATDSRGFAELNVSGNNVVTVSVFHAAYNYLTIANYDTTSSSPDARFLQVVLRRNQTDGYGGYKGTFKNVPVSSNVHAAVAGMSLAGSITDLSITQLLGPTEPTRVKIGNAIDQADVPLPAGTFLGFSDTQIKTKVSGQGLAGVCYTAAGAPDEVAIKDGRCGTRTAWGLAGDVPLGDLPIDAVGGGINNINWSDVLSRIIPIFKKFNSSVSRDVRFTLKQTGMRPDGGYDFSDTTHFVDVDHDFQQLPLAFSFVARSPKLPQFRGSYADGLLILGGTIVPGRGVIPLGIGAAVNTKPADDGLTDVQSELPAAGLVGVRMAPAHHGLEGSDYGLVAAAVSLKSINDASAGLATSAIFSRVPNNQLKFDPKGASPVDLTGGYLPFPEGAQYNYADAAIPGLTGRTFKMVNAPALTGTTLVRVQFTNRQDKRWVVLLDPSAVAAGFVLPKPPTGVAGLEDRTFFDSAATRRAPLLVQVLRLTENPSVASAPVVSFAKFVELNSFNGDRVTEFTTGFSLIDYSSPSIEWLTPKAAGETVAAATAVKVKVSSFRVGTAPGDDGFVRLAITGGSAACQPATPIDGTIDGSQGKGEIGINLPAGCTGAVTLTATLHRRTDMQPIAPAVSRSITATIQ